MATRAKASEEGSEGSNKTALDMLETLSVSELHEVIQRAEELRTQKLEGAKQEFMERVKAEAEGLGLSLSDLVTPPAAKRGRKPKEEKGARTAPAVKYRDPETGAEWSGRGRMAKRFAELTAQGRSLDEFLVNPAAE
jgi:DNA-binding protein H-NS